MRLQFSRKEHSDSALALVLICIAMFLIFDVRYMLYIALPVLLIAMTFPPLVFPFTFLWLNISHYLGKIVSGILLAGIFMLVVAPVAFVRKLMGKDKLGIMQFKKSDRSVMIIRKHIYSSNDIENPY